MGLCHFVSGWWIKGKPVIPGVQGRLSMGFERKESRKARGIVEVKDVGMLRC